MVFILSQSKCKAGEMEVKMLKYRSAESSWRQNSSHGGGCRQKEDTRLWRRIGLGRGKQEAG